MANTISKADDARIPEGMQIKVLKSGKVSYKNWILPLEYGHVTLDEGMRFLGIVAAPQNEIPEIIRKVEGKDSVLVKEFFYGGVDLSAHDYIHLILGRGLLTKDEAFVIGFTMGSTNRLASMNREIFAFIAQNNYPSAYQMDAEAIRIFFDAAKLGYISDCQPLDQIDFSPWANLSLDEIRTRINLFPRMIEAYYRDIEHRRHPDDAASIRLAKPKPEYGLWAFADPLRDESNLEHCAKAAKASLSSSDQPYEWDKESFVTKLSAIKDSMHDVLHEQKKSALFCLREVQKIAIKGEGGSNPDMDRWKMFFQKADASVSSSCDRVIKSINANVWESETEHLGIRAYIHALINRGASRRDRAFCRGFYDGSTNEKSSYAADLKSQVLEVMLITLDGPYTPDMKQSYQDGARMGFVSDCTPLNTIDFDAIKHLSVQSAREEIDLTTSIFEAYKEEVENCREFIV